MRLDGLVRRVLPGRPTVVVLPRPGAPIATFLRMDAGAHHEPALRAGTAHFLEHMLFKGTGRHGIGAAAAAIEALGGDVNAWTSHDEIVLHATTTTGGVRDVLDLLVDMVRDPLIDPDELAREREVVLEEIAQAHADPDDRLGEAVSEALWPTHAYGRPVLGTEQTVRGLTQDILRSHLAHAVTASPTFVIVGDLDPDDAVRQVDAAWSLPATRPTLPPPRGPSGPSTHLIRPDGRFDDQLLEIAWRGPDRVDDARMPALAVLVGLLGETAGDRLSEALDRDPKVGFDAWAALSEPTTGSVLSLGCRTLPGRTAEALGRIRALIDTLRRGTRGRVVARARDALLADLDSALQTVDGTGELLLHHECRHGDATHLIPWRAAIAAVEPDHVAQVAFDLLDPDAAVVGVLDRTVDDAAIKEAWHARPRPPRSTPPSGPLDTTLHGVPVRIVRTPGPLAAVAIRAQGGWLTVPPRRAGLAAAWSRTLSRGAGAMDAEAFFDALDERSAVMTARDGPAACHLSAHAPAAHLLDLLDLVGDVMVDPHFAEEEWAVVQEELFDEVRTRHERAAEVVGDRLAAVRYPGHAWRVPALGTASTLRGISARSLRRFHRSALHRGNLAVSVVGPLHPDDVLDALAWIEDLPEGSPFKEPAVPTWSPGRHAVTAGRTTARVEVWLDGPGRAAPAATRAAWRLAEGVLDGQAGRLFLEVRERQGLVYDVHPSSVRHAHHGLLLLEATTRPARIDATEQALIDALTSLVEHPPTAEELRRARNLLRGRDLRARQRVQVLAARHVRALSHGMSDGIDGLGDALDQVDGAHVAAVLAEALDRGPLIGIAHPLDDDDGPDA